MSVRSHRFPPAHRITLGARPHRISGPARPSAARPHVPRGAPPPSPSQPQPPRPRPRGLQTSRSSLPAPKTSPRPPPSPHVPLRRHRHRSAGSCDPRPDGDAPPLFPSLRVSEVRYRTFRRRKKRHRTRAHRAPHPPGPIFRAPSAFLGPDRPACLPAVCARGVDVALPRSHGNQSVKRARVQAPPGRAGRPNWPTKKVRPATVDGSAEPGMEGGWVPAGGSGGGSQRTLGTPRRPPDNRHRPARRNPCCTKHRTPLCRSLSFPISAGWLAIRPFRGCEL
ncbi:hypothetical protein DFJ74DRAFT_686377 [Hyaloraphidium curvatum]|nr:hypothetical protein DFJ74DRAFT_686377 [Hyaloraphidium curvatum]